MSDVRFVINVNKIMFSWLFGVLHLSKFKFIRYIYMCVCVWLMLLIYSCTHIMYSLIIDCLFISIMYHSCLLMVGVYCCTYSQTINWFWFILMIFYVIIHATWYYILILVTTSVFSHSHFHSSSYSVNIPNDQVLYFYIW